MEKQMDIKSFSGLPAIISSKCSNLLPKENGQVRPSQVPLPMSCQSGNLIKYVQILRHAVFVVILVEFDKYYQNDMVRQAGLSTNLGKREWSSRTQSGSPTDVMSVWEPDQVRPS